MADARQVYSAVSMLVLMIVASAVVGDASAASVTIAPENKNCWRDYRKFKKHDPHKAFFVTARYAKIQSCGWTYGYRSKKDAIGKALALCRAEAKRSKVRGPCQLFAVE